MKGGTLYWVSADHLGRPEIANDAAKQVVWRAANRAFDRSVGLDRIGGYNLGFPGQYHDAESGLWHNGFRDYEPTLGRYIQSDPIGLIGGISTYGYVGGNPTSRIDPFGLQTVYIGLDEIRTHLNWLARIQGDDFDTAPHLLQDRLMLGRLLLGRDTPADVAYWHHETTEAEMCREIREQNQRGDVSDAAALDFQARAHKETLRLHGNTEADLYHWSTAIVVFFQHGVWP